FVSLIERMVEGGVEVHCEHEALPESERLTRQRLRGIALGGEYLARAAEWGSESEEQELQWYNARSDRLLKVLGSVLKRSEGYLLFVHPHVSAVEANESQSDYDFQASRALIGSGAYCFRRMIDAGWGDDQMAGLFMAIVNTDSGFGAIHGCPFFKLLIDDLIPFSSEAESMSHFMENFSACLTPINFLSDHAVADFVNAIRRMRAAGLSASKMMEELESTRGYFGFDRLYPEQKVDEFWAELSHLGDGS
ncbi:MAG TPA: hypothetical protein VFX30_05745, partial [bacterium]|nr:hypothetical protein [bacterium]